MTAAAIAAQPSFTDESGNVWTRKQIARLLDAAAENCDAFDRTPATPKQCWYLAGLLFDREESPYSIVDLTFSTLTKKQASAAIDSLVRS